MSHYAKRLSALRSERLAVGRGVSTPQPCATRTPVPDMAADFHVYGLDWSNDELKWFFDGVDVGRSSTPSDMHMLMFVIGNMAIGGYWPKDPDAYTHFSAVYEIDWIRVYRRDRAPR
jgi:beta-glucanase (GH16 family)